MNNTNPSIHAGNQSLELFDLERRNFLALTEEINNVLYNPNDLTKSEKDFWIKKAACFLQYTIEMNEAFNKLKETLDAKTKAENAHLN